MRECMEALERQGHTLRPVDLPHNRYAVSTYYILATSEASSNLARYDGIRYGKRVSQSRLDDLYMDTRGQGFGPEVKRRILLGTFALSSGYYDAFYGRAQQVRTKIIEDFRQAFHSVDLILTPTSPTTAFELQSRTADPLQMYLADIFTIAVNLAGLPAASFPVGTAQTNKGTRLPIGAQLIAPAFEEDRLLQTVHAFQQATQFHHQTAPVYQRPGLAPTGESA